VRETRESRRTGIDPFAAGVFVGVVVAQVDVLRRHGHPWSEVANESIIEAVDSLIPYMHARGVAHMVDNCSLTARIGTRRWGPAFEALLARTVFPAAESACVDAALIDAFDRHPVHGVLAQLLELRPSIDIAVS
jgi:ketol-acid reductoisomerase